MSDDPLLLGIDIGTTRIRAIAFAADGRSLARGSRATPVVGTGPGRAHHEPEALWRATAEAIRDCVDAVAGRGRIVGAAAASVGESGVLLDADDRPTHPAIAWYDGRSEPQAAALERALGATALGLTHGLSSEPIFGLHKIMWIRENAPEAYERGRIWLNLADYAAFRLSGVAATDYSLACRTGALDLARLAWARDLVEAAGARASLFAPLRASGSRLGPVTAEAAAATGLATDCAVAVGAHDHICGALPSGAFGPGILLDSMGSAEALLHGLPDETLDLSPTARGFHHGVLMTERAHYFRVGCCFTSGVAMDWFRGLFAADDPAALLSQAQASRPGAGGARFLPQLRYATPPCAEKASTGAFLGLTPDIGRGDLYRAVLEGLAFDAQRLADAMIALPGGAAPREIRATGGGTRNRLLMSIKAALARGPLVVLDEPEAVSLGAALLGGVAARVYEDCDAGVAAVEPEGRIVEADPELTRAYGRLPWRMPGGASAPLRAETP